MSHWLLALLVTLNCVNAPKPGTNQDSKIKVTKETEIISSDFGLDDDYFQPSRPLTPFPHFPGVQGPATIGGFPGLEVPNLEGFSAVRAHPVSRICPRDTACVVLFENMLTPGRNFDKKAGFFVCNIPGLYYFSFAAISPAYTSFRIALVKNDHEMVSAYGSANGFSMAGNNILLLLQPGDRVCLKLVEGEIYESQAHFRAYTTFTGFLVQNLFSHRPAGPGGAGSGHKGFAHPNREPISNQGVDGFLEAGPRSLPSKIDDENGTIHHSEDIIEVE